MVKNYDYIAPRSKWFKKSFSCIKKWITAIFLLIAVKDNGNKMFWIKIIDVFFCCCCNGCKNCTHVHRHCSLHRWSMLIHSLALNINRKWINKIFQKLEKNNCELSKGNLVLLISACSFIRCAIVFFWVKTADVHTYLP